MDFTSRGRSVVLSAMLVSLVLALLPPVSASAEAPATPVDSAAPVIPVDHGDLVPGRLLVGLDGEGVPPGLATAIAAVGGEIEDHLTGIGVLAVAVPEGRVDRALERLGAVAGVAYVERDAAVELADRIPNDPRWPEQWGSVRTELPTAWATTVGSKDVVIAVLDTGVRADHADLKANVVSGRNILANNSDTSDPNGHGTLSAGVAAAVGGNAIGIAGACWNCRIMPVTVMEADGGGTTSNVAKGIEWAVSNGADVVSLSLGGTSGTKTLEDAVSYARNNDVVVVAAAGNCGANPDPCEAASASTYPGAYPAVLSVAGSDQSDALYPFSNYGSSVDVTAPGCNVSTALSGGYTGYCGTSSATPLVAGIVGLLRSAVPTATAEQVRKAIQETSRSRSYVRYGRVDAAAALEVLLASVQAPEPEEPPKEEEPSLEVERLAGGSGTGRIETAVAVSKSSHPGGAKTVLLANSHGFADALAGAPLAKKLGAPVLLTGGTSLEKSVKDELTRLKATEFVLLGGTGAISGAVETELKAMTPNVRRHAGKNRYETAAKIASEVLKGQGGTQHAYLVNGSESWADAVAVSGLAAQQGRPILLATKDRLPDATTKAITDLGLGSVTVVGGDGVLSSTVRLALSILVETPTPIAGKNRYDTSRRIADAAVSAGASPADVWVATGRNFPDALAAGPAVAASGGVLLLINGIDTGGSKETYDWIARKAGGIERVKLVGGTGVITNSVRSHVEKLAQGD